MLTALLAWGTWALAAQVAVVLPSGPPFPGERVSIEVATGDASGPVRGPPPALSASRGRVTGAVTEVGPGRYLADYVAPGSGADVDEIRVQFPGAPAVAWPIAIRPAMPRLASPRDADAPAGAPRVEVLFPAADPPEVEDVLVRASEGRVLEVRREANGIRVALQPGPERAARVLAVGVLDLRLPGAQPAWGIVRLRGRHSGNVTAEPGSRVTLRLGGRSYGPFVADSTGSAAVSFESLPGEGSYAIGVADDLGNTQEIESPLQAVTRPVVLALERATASGLDILLAAWTASGVPWGGVPATCRTTGDREPAVPLGRGTWRFGARAAPGGESFDVRVECGVADSIVPLRVPVRAGVPARVELRVYPGELDADFPLAEAQAVLLDARGDRLPPEGLELQAEWGEVIVERRGDALRAEYRGSEAVAHGTDVVRASWSAAPSRGAAWSVDAWARWEEGRLAVLARPRGRSGGPLAGIPVEIRVGDVLANGITDASGWVSAELAVAEGDVARARVVAGAAMAEVAAFRGGGAALPEPSAPDLWERVSLPIRAGKVRQVFLAAEPRPLLTGGGDTATISVRLLDAAGNQVRDEPLRIEASEGTVGALFTRADGTVEASYAPPPGQPAGVVRITARSGLGSWSTELELVPRPVRGSVGIDAGWLSNLGAVSSPRLGLSLEHDLPVPLLGLRLGVGAYRFEGAASDASTGQDIAVQAEFVPIDLGLVVGRRSPRWSFSAGVSGVLLPHLVRARVGGELAVDGAGVGPPAALVRIRGGHRVDRGEVIAELGYLYATLPGGALSFEGNVGGLQAGVGYRLWY